MEENSEVNSVKELFSNTTELPDSQQAVGVHVNVETVILVEQVKEEEIINNGTAIEVSDNESKDMYEAPINSELSPKKDHIEKIVISPSKVDHITNLNQNTSTKPDQMHKTSTMSECVQRILIRSENQQKSPTKVEQVFLPEKIQINSTKTDKLQKVYKKSEEGLVSQIKPVQVQFVQSKLEQKQDVLAKPGQAQKMSETCKQVQKSQPLLNQVQKIKLIRPPIKSLSMQSENKTNASTVINSKETNLVTVIKPLEGLEAVLVQKIPTKQASLVKESPKKYDPSMKSPGILNPTKEPENSSTKVSSVQLDSNKESPTKPDQIKESLDKAKEANKYDKKKESVFKSSIEICDKSNDSQVDTIFDISEKDQHNTITSREEHNNKSINKEEHNNKFISIEEHNNKSINKEEHNNKFISIEEHNNKSITKEEHNNKSIHKEEHNNKSITKEEHNNKSIHKEEHNNKSISKEEHNNKGISRELKSLIKSAKESKIISECTQLTSKTRKSRTAFDNSNTSLNTSVEADKIHSVRRSSITSQKSNSSEKSEKAPTKRSMRSQNPEFVNKVKQFLSSVTGKIQKDTDDEEIDDKKETNFENISTYSKKKKIMEPQQLDPAAEQTNKLRSDIYCWRCHWAVEQPASDKGHSPLQCTVCPRSFHYKCLSGNERSKTINEKSWVCPECLTVLHAESSETRSPAMKKMSLGLLCELLQYALGRMMDLNGVEPFMHPVDRTAFPDYEKYVVHPMDLNLMKKNISEGLYGSTEAFLADAQWILHNSIIFNTLQSKLTAGARALVRSCRAEMGEIEACSECYAAAHARRPTWFTDVCSTPHMLLWAKLKGFPYWPAKGMSVNSQGLVDVRFFGAHDRAWVPARDCFLYCERDPNNFKAKRQDILESMQEAEQHIRNISRKYGKFVYPPFKTQFEPTKLTEQLKMMIPSFDGEIKAQVKEKSVNTSPNATQDTSRSNSKSSKSSINDGDISDNEDTQAAPCRKMADGAEIAREDEDFSIEKDKPMEVSEPAVENKEKEHSRKRRRSGLEEAVITIITTSSSEKRQKLETTNKEEKKTESPQETSGKEEDASKIDKSDKKNEKTNKANDKEVPSTPISIDMNIPNIEVQKAPIIIFTPKIRSSKTSTLKEKTEKSITPKRKLVKTLQSAETEKKKQDENIKSQKRRKSRSKSLNSSQLGKADKTSSKRNERDNLPSNSKEKIKEPNLPVGGLETNNVIDVDKAPDKTNSSNKTNTETKDSSKQAKDHTHFDDDTSLAVIARETAKHIVSGLPTISSVRSLSTIPSNTTSNPTVSKPITNTNKIEITVAAHPDVNVFTPTSTDSVRSMKEAVDKLQKLKNGKDKPAVGRVGVRAFARMTSPPALPPPPEKQAKDTVEVEVKSEPIDFDDADRQVEKIDLMRAFHLRPVNPVTTANLRDVRINKVLVAPIARKAVTKTTEVRIRARKTFPQARKDESDGRSELNGKNSMVYIPIRPPSTQAPIQRQTRPITINGSANTQTVRPQVSAVIANSVVNTVSTALVPLPMTSSLSSPTFRPAATVVTNSASNAVCVPTVGQVPTAVHTVPLITSVNGQWTFSLQPVMSVGGDGATSPPVVNGHPERNQPFVPIAPATPHITLPSSQILPNKNNNEITPGEPPRLQQRPPLLNPLDPNTPSSEVPAPSTAGPLTAKLSQNAVKLADFFRNLLEDSLEKIEEPASQATFLKLQLEQAQWRHQQQVNELKHAHELLTTEMRVSFEKEKARAISEMRRTAQVELEAAVKAAKTKQWCANCTQEAQFYCCWNTSYCDYSCQRSHWSQHFAVCSQQRNSDNNANENGTSLDKRLQPAPDSLPKSTSTPTLAVGTKITPTRVYTQDGLQQKPSIIVSMVDDHSGNPMLKCVGTYKTAGTQQVSPLIINKQVLNEDATKKVVTSGGYLIVGAGNNSPITAARRTHPVQYTYST